MVGTWVQLSGGLGPDGLAVNADGFVAVAHGQAGRAWVFDPSAIPWRACARRRIVDDRGRLASRRRAPRDRRAQDRFDLLADLGSVLAAAKEQ
jgi:hypothetical protein